MRLTDEQAQEMERQLVLRILGDACQEYAYAVGELERSDGFRRYVMHRAKSSGFTIEEIAEATALSASVVEGILYEDGGTTAVAKSYTAIATGDASTANGDTGTANGEGDADTGTANGDTGTANGDTGTATGDLSTASGGAAVANGDGDHRPVVAGIVLNGSDGSDFDDLADAIGHLNIQIGDESDDPVDAVEMIEPETAPEPSRLPWSWNRS